MRKRLTRRDLGKLTAALLITPVSFIPTGNREVQERRSYKELTRNVSELMKKTKTNIEYAYTDQEGNGGVLFLEWNDLKERNIPYSKLEEIEQGILEEERFNFEYGGCTMYISEERQ